MISFLSISPEEAIAHLKNNQPVAIPTETVYGLAASIRSPEAIEKVFLFKQRPFFDPLIVHISKMQHLDQIIEGPLPPLAFILAEKFWPGPLTMVLPKNKNISSMITSGLNTVAVRIPNHKLALNLIDQVGPLAAPSANRFGKTSPTTATHVAQELPGVQILDGGPCSVGIESTVIGFSPNNTIIIYRPGAITKEMLLPFASVEEETSPVSPGHLKHHYMPDKKFVILKSKHFLSFDDYELLIHALHGKKPHLAWIQLSEKSQIAARQFYAELRQQSERSEIDILIWNMHNIPNVEMWSALKDRALKAASLVI